MSDYVLVGLTGTTLVLPLVISGIARIVFDHLPSTPLAVKLVLIFAWVVAIGLWFGFFAYATGRCEKTVSEETIIICWVVGFVFQAVSFGTLVEAYE